MEKDMKSRILLNFIICSMSILLISCSEKGLEKVTVPIKLDHNRMLVNAEIQRTDSSWRKVLLWVDTGNPDFFISEGLADDLGISLRNRKDSLGNDLQSFSVNPPSGVRIGRKLLDFKGVNSLVIFSPRWLFTTMHVDANLPSTVLEKYQVVFDYPELQLTLADSGTIKHEGNPSRASVNSITGIVQIDAMVDGESLSFALDNGASYSIISDELMKQLFKKNPEWPGHTGALGCANIWGWWEGEQNWQLIRIPEIIWGSTILNDVGVIGLPQIINWYSKKTVRPINGFLGANALKSFRVEIDYKNSMVYFEKGVKKNNHDLDLVGLTLRPENDGNYKVIGVAEKDGKPSVEGVEPGDLLIKIDELTTKGETMGNVIDALRGHPGDTHTLVLKRNKKQFEIKAYVERFL